MQTTSNPKLVILNLPEDRGLNEQELKEVLLALANGINQLGEAVAANSTSIAELKEEMKGWFGWLRLISGVIIVTVGVSFLSIVLPLGIALWKQTLV